MDVRIKQYFRGQNESAILSLFFLNNLENSYNVSMINIVIENEYY